MYKMQNVVKCIKPAMSRMPIKLTFFIVWSMRVLLQRSTSHKNSLKCSMSLFMYILNINAKDKPVVFLLSLNIVVILPKCLVCFWNECLVAGAAQV